jgi:hypothetical protein
LYLLFEVSVGLSTIIYRRRTRRLAAAAAAEPLDSPGTA